MPVTKGTTKKYSPSFPPSTPSTVNAAKTVQKKEEPAEVSKQELYKWIIETVGKGIKQAPAIRDLFAGEIANLHSGALASVTESKLEAEATVNALADTAVKTLEEMKKSFEAELEIAKAKAVKVLKLESPDPNFENEVELYHYRFPLLVKLIHAGNPLILIGPTQSGKSKSVQLAAQMLKRSYNYIAFGPTMTETALKGHTTATGRYVPSPLYYAVKNGYVLCGDEWDTANPSVPIWMNNGTSNGLWSFPIGINEAGEQEGGLIAAHPDFRMVLTANTWGRGADSDFVGRNPADASVMARYDRLAWDYDDGLAGMLEDTRKGLIEDILAQAYKEPTWNAGLEFKLAINKFSSDDTAKWVGLVQRMRLANREAGIQGFISSPSHSMRGANNLAHGIDLLDVADVSLFAGLDESSLSRLGEFLNG